MIVCVSAFFGHIQLYPTGMSIDDYPCQSLPSQWSLLLQLFDVHLWRSLLSSHSPRCGHCCCRYSDGAVAVTVVSRSLRSSSCFLMPTTEEGEGVALLWGSCSISRMHIVRPIVRVGLALVRCSRGVKREGKNWQGIETRTCGTVRQRVQSGNHWHKALHHCCGRSPVDRRHDFFPCGGCCCGLVASSLFFTHGDR